jgi:hypothetical protein
MISALRPRALGRACEMSGDFLGRKLAQGLLVPRSTARVRARQGDGAILREAADELRKPVACRRRAGCQDVQLRAA